MEKAQVVVVGVGGRRKSLKGVVEIPGKFVHLWGGILMQIISGYGLSGKVVRQESTS